MHSSPSLTTYSPLAVALPVLFGAGTSHEIEEFFFFGTQHRGGEVCALGVGRFQFKLHWPYCMLYPALSWSRMTFRVSLFWTISPSGRTTVLASPRDGEFSTSTLLAQLLLVSASTNISQQFCHCDPASDRHLPPSCWPPPDSAFIPCVCCVLEFVWLSSTSHGTLSCTSTEGIRPELGKKEPHDHVRVSFFLSLKKKIARLSIYKAIDHNFCHQRRCW